MKALSDGQAVAAEKQCAKCKETKPAAHFTRVIYKGYKSWCKTCCSQYAAQRAEKERAKRKAWLEAIQSGTAAPQPTCKEFNR